MLGLVVVDDIHTKNNSQSGTKKLINKVFCLLLLVVVLFYFSVRPCLVQLIDQGIKVEFRLHFMECAFAAKLFIAAFAAAAATI